MVFLTIVRVFQYRTVKKNNRWPSTWVFLEGLIKTLSLEARLFRDFKSLVWDWSRNTHQREFLEVQWLGLGTYPVVAQVHSLVGELRSCKASNRTKEEEEKDTHKNKNEKKPRLDCISQSPNLVSFTRELGQIILSLWASVSPQLRWRWRRWSTVVLRLVHIYGGFVQTQVAGCTPRVSDSVGLAGSGVGLRALCF